MTTADSSVLLRLEDQAHDIGWSFFGQLITEARSSIDTFDDSELAIIERFLRSMVQVVIDTRATQNQLPVSDE